MRQYGMTQVQVPYRYTGQEWDEETGLYNYHARLYDPDIGRFYQIDPQEQYASPYKYAGNSPVSMIDPSGEIAFLPILMIGLGFLGGYSGGSAANNSWAPWEWDLTTISTYLGIGGGALAGALAPVGFTASVGALVVGGLPVVGAVAVTSVLGVTVMYFSMASANNSWNPFQWQWSRPMTWNGGFQGFIFGAGAIAGIGAWYQYYKSFGFAGQVAFAVSSGVLSVGMAYLSCAAVNASFNPKKWKLSPGTIYAGLGGLFGGCMAPVGLMSTWQTICSFETTTARLLMGFTTIGSGLCTSYVFVSAANDSFSWSNWDMSSPKTFTTIIGGILFGISLPGLPRAFRDGMKRTSETWKRREYCQQDDRQFGNEAVPGDPIVDQQPANEAVPGDPIVDQQPANEAVPGDPIVDQQPANEAVPGDPIVDQQPANEAVQRNYEIDQQVANEIADKVNHHLRGDQMPTENGVIAIGTMRDGTKIFAYSGGQRDVFVAGTVNRNGASVIYIGKASDVNVPLDELVLYEHITKNLNCTIEDVQRLGGMPNERGHNFPRNPATCAEPRVMIIAFDLGYTKDDFVSITPFRREPLGVAPVPPCGNCQATLDMIFPR